jgi:hypothetical protein
VGCGCGWGVGEGEGEKRERVEREELRVRKGIYVVVILTNLLNRSALDEHTVRVGILIEEVVLAQKVGIL